MMFPLRRAALRFLSTPSTVSVASLRKITTSTRLPINISRPASVVLAQRRWASDYAEGKEDDAPISKLQPTPLEEVENAVKEDEVVKESSAEAQQDAEAVQNIENTSDTIAPTPKQSAAVEEFYAEQDRRFAPKATIYVGNLFFDVTEDDLTKEFSTIGKIVRCRVIRDARGLSKGFGYITFANIEQATKAITTLNQQLFEGRRLSLQYATHDDPPSISVKQGGPKNPPSKTLFIGNMSWEMTDRDLNNLFRGIRNVIDVRVAIDRRTGQPRGFAHADFIDIKSAMEAQKVLVEKELYGRRLRIDYSYTSSAAPRNQARDQGQSFPPPSESRQE